MTFEEFDAMDEFEQMEYISNATVEQAEELKAILEVAVQKNLDFIENTLRKPNSDLTEHEKIYFKHKHSQLKANHRKDNKDE